MLKKQKIFGILFKNRKKISLFFVFSLIKN